MPQKLASLMADCQVSILKDPLASFLSTSRCLNPIVDTCMENIGGFKIKLLELIGQDQWYAPILKHLNLQPQCAPEYFISNATEETSPIIASGTELEAVAQWADLLQPPPATIESIANATILSDSLSTLSKANIIQTLKNVATTVKEKGFIIVKEPTKKSAYALALKVLSSANLSPEEAEETTPADASSQHRQFGLFYTDDQWREIFQSAGLHLVSSKSDGLVNSLFLCRKIEAISGTHEFFNIDDAAFGWVEALKLKLQEFQVGERGDQ